MSEKLTYWQLIDSNRIEIPVIQRDYAQGRDEDRINALRIAFISDLKSSISGEGEPLHLGFVYGKVEGKDKYQERLRNKRAIENILNAVEGYAQHLEMKIETKINSDFDSKNDNSNLPTFIPLDGQQRLTTLFLIHWYLSLFYTENKQDVVNILSRFTYKTRKSSFEFCRAITDNKTHSDFENIGADSISEFIKKRKWFRRTWLKDSTVKGMLTVLDEIQVQFKDVDDKTIFFGRLINDKAPIFFDFLDLDELNQTDELYVKMNARGKQLSEFEHFKAWLIHHVKENNITVEEQDWKTKLDKDWLDLFWKNKGTSYSVDSTIYNFIKQVTLFAYIQGANDKFNLGFTSTVRESEFVPFSIYEEYDFFNSDTLNFVFNTLNHLCNDDLMGKYKDWLADIACHPFIPEEDDLLLVFTKNSKSVDRPLSVFYYSLLLYLSKATDVGSENDFKTWMRFSRNLIYNTYIQNPENYVDAIRGLNALIQSVKDNSGINFTSKSVSFFGNIFLYNETIKINLINTGNPRWKELILKYENHEYFRGDIRIIFSFSQGDIGEYNLDDFERYGSILSELFGSKIRSHKEVLLQRAILTKGLYMPHVGSNYLFCLPNSDTLRARRDNWQKVFSDEKKRLYLKQLIDENLSNEQEIETELRNVIKAYSENDWRKYLIKSSLPIRFCDKGYVRLQGTISMLDSKIEVFLLRTSKLYGRHAELRSYYQYETSIKKLDNKLPFTELGYWENRMSQYTYPCIRFENWEFNGVNYKLEVTYSEDKKYQFFLLSEEGDEEVHQNIIKCCEELGWQTSDDKLKCYLSTDEEATILNNIRTVLEALNSM